MQQELQIITSKVLNNSMMKLFLERKEVQKVLGENCLLYAEFYPQINEIEKENGKCFSAAENRFIALSLKLGFTDLFDRFKKYKTINGKSHSIDNYIFLYGELEGTVKYKEKNKKGNVPWLDKYINKYGVDEGAKKYRNRCKRSGGSVEKFIERHGKDIGIVKYNKFCEKNKRNKTLERQIELYGEVEGTIRYFKIREKDTINKSLLYFINKYGDERGNEIFNSRIDKLHLGSSRQGYIKKYGNQGISICKKDKDHKSLEYNIERYGPVEGNIKYNMQSDYQRYRNTLDWYIEKHGIDIGTQEYIKYTTTRSGFSRISQELFEYIDDNTHELRYATKVGEYFISRKSDIIYFYDLVDLTTKKIIEFNGDIFHGNPAIFTENDKPNPWKKDLTCTKIWEYDNKKIKCAESRGFSVLIVWEKDYKENKQREINKCKKFLYE